MIALYSVVLPIALGLVGFVLMWVAGVGRGAGRTARRTTVVIANVLLGLALIFGVLISDQIEPEGLALWMMLGWSLGVAARAIVMSLRPAKQADGNSQDT